MFLEDSRIKESQDWGGKIPYNKAHPPLLGLRHRSELLLAGATLAKVEAVDDPRVPLRSHTFLVHSLNVFVRDFYANLFGTLLTTELGLGVAEDEKNRHECTHSYG